MVLFPLKTEEEMRREQVAARRPRRFQSEAPQPLNTRAVLDLGSKISFQFRGRTYWIPPLPWRAGERLMLLWTSARRYEGALTTITAPGYYAAIRQMPALLWRHCYPGWRVGRVRHALRLMRNAFMQATEQELVELAHFFLQRRMTSSVGFQPMTTADRSRPTS